MESRLDEETLQGDNSALMGIYCIVINQMLGANVANTRLLFTVHGNGDVTDWMLAWRDLGHAEEF